MKALKVVLDGYERKARLYPALLLVLPLVAACTAIASANLGTWQAAGTFFLGCGGAFLLTQLARDLGYERQPALFGSWGGPPSIAIFRHRHSRLDPITKTRYHKKLSKLVPEAKAPSPELEQSDPETADVTYAAWAHYLRVNTRDTKKFALLFQENVSYGFRRNIWGLRRVGIAVSAFSFIVSTLQLCFGLKADGKIDVNALVAVVVCGIFLLLWVFRFTSEWVRLPANAYAERLVEAVESFPTANAANRKSTSRTGSKG